MSDLKNKDLKSSLPDFAFNRFEFSGSLGDLGTFLPIAIAMIVLNGLNVTNVMVTVGMFYIISGFYFKVPIPVQPMKVIGAYAIAVGLTPSQIVSASLWMGICVLVMGTTGLIHIIGKYTPKSTIRGVQLGVGIILMIKGLGFMIEPDPNLAIKSLGPVNMGIVIGILAMVLTFLLLENKKVPAAVIVISAGILLGVFIGKPVEFNQLEIGFNLPMPFPYGMPAVSDLMWVIPALVLPQLPMTIGNAILSNTDLMHEYFGKRARRATYRSIANSQGIADIVSFIWGGIPMCHGAGGLAASYRFGARTAGSNIMIGSIFILLGILFGQNAIIILNLLPLSILGVLLIFSGAQLALMIQDLEGKKDLLVTLIMLVITLTINLAAAFICGIIIAYISKSKKINI
jgi:SulP family sulfate permease